jgi:hypothetical protein
MFKPKGIVGKASNCLILFFSMISSVVITLTVLAICCALVGVDVVVFALPVGAGVDVAELGVVVGALEPPELVWLLDGALAGLSVGVETCVETVVTLDVAEAVTVLVVAAAGEDTTLVGLSGLIGLTGLVTFVGFVTLFTHVLEVVVQTPGHIGEP